MTDTRTPYGTRLALSGVESRKLLEIFADFKVPHIQLSYYYLKRVFQDPQEFEQYSAPFTTVLIDSGTVYHKFRTDDEKGEFINDYASYIAALNKNAYTACVYEKNSNLEKVCADEALIYPIDMMLPVFENDSSALFKNLLYIGVPQSDTMYKGGERLNAYFQYAKRSNSLLHAFGTSSKRILGKYPFYSANSSSWRSGSRYLNTYIYEGVGRGMRMYQPRDKQNDPVSTEKEMRNIRKRQYTALASKRPHIAAHIDKDQLYEGNSWEVDKANLAHWMKYQEDLENNGRGKYWLSDEERTSITQRKREEHSLTANTPTEGHIENIDKENRHIESKETIKVDYIGEGYIESEYIETPIADADIVEDENNPITAIENIEHSRVPAPTHISINSRVTRVDPRIHAKRQCEDCSLNDRCVRYTPNGSCAYGLDPEYTPNPEDTPDVIREQMADMLLVQYDRLMQATLEEKLDAAGLNRDTTANMKLMMEMHRMYMEITNPTNSVSIKAKGPGIIDLFKKK